MSKSVLDTRTARPAPAPIEASAISFGFCEHGMVFVRLHDSCGRTIARASLDSTTAAAASEMFEAAVDEAARATTTTAAARPN